jgi:hypothetical protein
VREYTPIAQCIARAENLALIQRCIGRWGGDSLWNCMRANPALQSVFEDALNTAAGQAPRLSPPAAATTTPVAARCPTVAEFAPAFARCLNNAVDNNPRSVVACFPDTKAFAQCAVRDPALEQSYNQIVDAAMARNNALMARDRMAPAYMPPAPGPSAVQPAAPATLPGCGPELAMRVVQAIEKTSPGAESAVKALALQQMMATFGCVGPPQSPPRPQITDCQALGGGMTTCVTR